MAAGLRRIDAVVLSVLSVLFEAVRTWLGGPSSSAVIGYRHECCRQGRVRGMWQQDKQPFTHDTPSVIRCGANVVRTNTIITCFDTMGVSAEMRGLIRKNRTKADSSD
ncbi:hypothetical protein GCM10010365_23180 [Streptomyces poonensis]|uniref:Uncharacterized protein n=1 Tax=Streptomyces poonensis TaxID=68255 RepID=A0A918PG19_9ACTN|nr:hypothetical protein GCM10010365_23180 [Streptomyces poonensis]GLJ90757.1 hypothetical protein GCM10017589_33620 [Streptomyces poonensis]